MAEITEAEAEAKILAASAKQSASDVSGAYAVVPDGFTVQSLEDFQGKPSRIKTRHEFRNTDSLAKYLARFQKPETVALSSPSDRRIKAVIDHHDHTAEGGQSHCDHLATFCAQFTPQYEEWRNVSGKSLTQVAAGLFLEERATDVIDPDAASIMDMVMQFDALKKVTFKQSTRLHDGQRQFQYLEENEARGNVTLPERITLLVPVFDGQDPDRITVRVKYRIEDGSLRFSFEIHDRQLVEDTAFKRCEDALASATTDLLILQTV